jgi:hypothetical protein
MAYTPEQKLQFVEIFRKNAGDISLSCKAFGMDRVTFYEWFNNDKTFHDQIETVRDELLDFAESQLFRLMRGIPIIDKTGKQTGWSEKPNPASVIFYLKTKGKLRGYIERSEIIQQNVKHIDGINYIVPTDPGKSDNNPADI